MKKKITIETPETTAALKLAKAIDKVTKPAKAPAKKAKAVAATEAKPKSAAAPKKAAAKSGAKPVAAEKAVAKAPAKKAAKAASKTVDKSEITPARLIVKCDAGWGNSLHLRGEGEGLSWNAGTPLTCAEGTEWIWTAPIAEPIIFKILLNDQTWATGDNLVLLPGELLVVSPRF